MVHLAVVHPLWGRRIAEELSIELGAEVRHFDSSEELLSQDEVPDARVVLVEADSELVLEKLARGECSVVLALSPPGETGSYEHALQILGPLKVSPWPYRSEDALPKLRAALRSQALERDLQAARHSLVDRDRALRRTQRHAALASEELEARESTLQTATERLMEAEKLAAVGRVVTGIAHELSNQLALVGYAEAIKSRVDSTSELYEFADAIALAQRRLTTMVDQMRHFVSSEAQSSVFEAASLKAVVDEALTILRYDRDVRCRVIEKDYRAEPLVRLHREQFAQVVINLVSNAVLATEANGRIEIGLCENEDEGLALFWVKDGGQGMSEEVQGRLGEAFFTTRGERGSGLGVGICMAIARAHGGRIRYESEIGVGTTATVELPLLEEEPGGEDLGR